jgi:hypothetical protein
MSALDRPRLHFMGTMAVSTPTANNNNYDLVVEPQQATLYPKFLAMSDAQFRQAMKTLVLKNLSIVNMGIAEVLEANWNFYGDNSVVWRDATITAYDPPGGGRITTGDPILGQPITLLGNQWGDGATPAIIVDIDPTSDFSSQIFAAQLGVGGSGATTPGFTATTNAQTAIPRTHSHWLDLARNPAVFPDATFAATWQLALPNGTLAFAPGASQAVKDLQTAAAAAQGLVVRFATYYFNRKYTDPQLAALFAQGKTVQNESAGVLLGTIAPWLPGEWGTVPDGRRLNPKAVLTNSIPKVFVSTFSLAPAAAAVDAAGKNVVLDLIAAFRDTIIPPPPLNTPPPPPSDLQKYDLGVATLQVVDAAGATHDIGAVPYDEATYLAGAGIVEIAIPAGLADTIAAGTLQIVSPASTDPLLVETPLVAESDDRATYLTLGQAQTITVNVFSRGVAPGAPVPVMVQQYRSLEIMPPSPDGTEAVPAKLTVPVTRPWSDRKPSGAVDDPANPYAVVTAAPQGGMTDAQGTLRMSITGVDPGMCILVFVPDGQNPPPPDLNGFAPAWADLYFVHVRVLPADADLDAIPDSDITWDLVYDKVLRYFYKMFPVMDAHLVLNDETACRRAAQMLLLLTDASNWDSTLYMPITRELSDGKRRLLARWCRLVMSGATT